MRRVSEAVSSSQANMVLDEGGGWMEEGGGGWMERRGVRRIAWDLAWALGRFAPVVT